MLNEFEVTCFYLDSLPTGTTNSALPRTFVKDHVIFFNGIEADSKWTAMIQSKATIDHMKSTIKMWTTTGREDKPFVSQMQGQQPGYYNPNNMTG